MLHVHVQIVRYTDDSQPGWVECQLVDARGRLWTFVEKVPIVSVESLDADSAYPRPGTIHCEIVGDRRDSTGHEIVRIDTEKPFDIASVDGTTQFDVSPGLLVMQE